MACGRLISGIARHEVIRLERRITIQILLRRFLRLGGARAIESEPDAAIGVLQALEPSGQAMDHGVVSRLARRITEMH